MRTLVLAAIAATAFAAPAMAQTVSPQWYGTLGYSQFDHSDGDLGAVTAGPIAKAMLTAAAG